MENKNENENPPDVVQIFAVLLGGENRNVSHALPSIPPSVYMEHMSLTTEELIASLMKRECGRPSTCFSAIPKIVIFQKFTTGNTYRATLTLRNITPLPQCLKIIRSSNPWFKLECKDATYKRKLAPGMNVVYDVKFSPDERRDYKYRAIFSMDTEIFNVDILAIGPRAVLDFPDFVELPQTAVKINSSKSLLVRNIGEVSAVFTLSTKCPFAVQPEKGILPQGETMQVTVNFFSEEKGCYNENLFVNYETGEIMRLNLCGSAESCVIRLEKGTLKMEETYLGLTRSKIFAIYNRSDYVVNFQWVLYKNRKKDRLEREKYERSFAIIKNIEISRKVDLDHYNICDPLAHEFACQRIFADELSCLTDHIFPFRHPNFKVIPMEGEIWPRSSVDVTVFFEPDEVGAIEGKAYLEVTGSEERIRLNLHGTCIGPSIKLNVASLDVGFIFLCSKHNYEVICGNKGDIPGTLVYKIRPTDFGGKIDVTPPKVKLKPGEFKSFNLSFWSNRNGEFIETVDFVVKESLEVISLRIKGTVLCPTLHFDKNSLDFGVTAIGFTTKQDVTLHNSSLVPVTFCLSVTHDGTQPALTRQDFAKCAIRSIPVANPKEFIIEPDEGIVAPNSSQRIKISYTPNLVRSGQTTLEADMWDSDSEPVTLPIIFTSKVASIVVKPYEILIRFCFINFPYTRSVTVENKSDVEGCFYLSPQSVTTTGSSPIVYSLSSHQGYLKPNESKTVSLKIITTALGWQKVQLSLLVFGERSTMPCCSLICNGQGPVVTVQPNQLNWGEIQLLEEVKSTINLYSDSPIPAQFFAQLHKKRSPWTVYPLSGVLEPNKSLKLEITVYLRDAMQYSDTVDIRIANGKTITCSLSAIGVGTSIEFNPKVTPVFDMGLLFRNQDVSSPITMVNRGTRHHRLTWTTTADFQAIEKSGTQQRQIDKFAIDPIFTELPPGASVVVLCKTRWEMKESISEQWYLHGQIEGVGKRQVVASSLFKATFTDPSIVFNKKNLLFRYDAGSSGTETCLTDKLFVTNQSGPDLGASMKIDPPFELLLDDENVGVKSGTIILRNGVATPICVKFDVRAIDSSNLYSRTFQGFLRFNYEADRAKEKIKCLAELNYPNVSILPDPSVNIGCEIGTTACKDLSLVNTGRFPIRYSFEWLDDKLCIKTGIPSGKREDDSILKEEEEEEGETKSEAQEEDSSTSMNMDGEELEDSVSSVQVFASEIRDFIFPMIARYFVDDTEIPVLESLPTFTTEPQSRPQGRISEILDIVPREGTVPAYSSQYVHIEFDASQPLEIEAEAVCRVEFGPSEATIVRASCDAIRYSIDKERIDFGRQLFCELCRSALTIANLSKVELNFEAHLGKNLPPNDKEKIDQTGNSRAFCLCIEPRCGIINSMSEVNLDISYYSGVPGPFYDKFDLEIGHHAPVPIYIEGYGSLPQVYLTIPRDESLDRIPADIRYRAIGTLSTQFLTETEFATSARQSRPSSGRTSAIDDDDSILKFERDRLTANGWEVVFPSEENLPSEVDVEMAVEQLLMIEKIRQNPYVLMKLDSVGKKRTIPSLFVPEYVIDVGYVVIGRVAHYSAMLFNYGPSPVDVRLTRTKSNRYEKNSGFIVQFRDRKGLPVGDSTPLNVTFYPTQSAYTENRTDVEHTIHLEVTYGAIVPIFVRAVVTYPFLTANTSRLLFEEVAVGECKMMPILLRNEGWTPCEWEATIPCKNGTRSKDETGPFFLHYSSDTYLPGRENVINVYFKPKEGKHFEAQLKIKIEQSIFTILITLAGTGVKPKLYVSNESLNFEPAIPYAKPETKTILIKNINSYPIEIFWRNFDTKFLEEDRIIRLLTHYYGVDEILFPPRRPGDRFSPRVYDFCQSLSDEMTAAYAARKSKAKSEFRDSEPRENEEAEENVEEEKEDEEEVARVDGESNVDRRQNSAIDEFPEIPIGDLDQMEALLHHYIDELRKREDFSETMRDPLKEIFEDAEIKKMPSNDRSSPSSRLFIIFHGAPFTSYQQAACRLGKMIGISVLNIDNAITEIIATGKTACSNKLREIIDKNYDQLISTLQPRRERAEDAEKNTEDSPAMTSPKILEKTEDNEADNNFSISPKSTTDRGVGMERIFLKLPAETDALEELKKMPGPEELESMDSFDKYEWKIRSVLLLEKIVSSGTTPREKMARDPGNDKVSTGRGAKKSGIENTFLGIEFDLISEALEQRISMDDFRAGFVLQTLNNIFVKNEYNSLSMLLNIVGNVKKPLFVTFHNNFENCLAQNEKLIAAEEIKTKEVLRNKLEEIDEMTWSEYENVSEEDKILYASKTLGTKKEDSLRRRSIRKKKLVEALEKRKISLSVKCASDQTISVHDSVANKTKNKLSEKLNFEASRSNKSESTKRNRTTATNIGKNRTQEESHRNTGNTKRTQPKGFEEIFRLMNEYQTSLATLQPLLTNWNPNSGNRIDIVGKNGGSPKTARARDAAQRAEENKGFEICYIAPMDPWNSELYDKILSHLADTEEYKIAVANQIQPEKTYQMNFNLYYVATRKSACHNLLLTPNDAFVLTSVTNGSATSSELPVDLEREDAAKELRAVNPSAQIYKGSIVEGELLKSRWIMQPEEVVSFNVSFFPKSIGIHKHNYYMTIVGSNVTQCIELSGSTDLPRLNLAPEVIFDKVRESKNDDINESAFYLDTGTYDFGSMLLSKTHEKKFHKRVTRFAFKNVSTVLTTLTAFLMDNSTAFGVEPDSLNIAPGETEILNLWAGVSTPGPNLESLILCIKNSPQVEMIPLRSWGCQLELELEGKIVSFGKILLRRKEKRTIVVKNKCNVAFYWKLNFIENLPNAQIALHPEKGFVSPLGTSKIECSYNAESVGLVECSASFQICLEKHETEPLFTDFVNITGETYDVEVDVICAAPVDFKIVELGTSVTQIFVIKNRGPYDIEFVVQPENPENIAGLKPNLATLLIEDFLLEPSSGTLRGGESATIAINFEPRHELTISELPFFKCRLIDKQKISTTVAEVPILVSFSVHCAKVKIQPSEVLDFGSVAVFEKKTMYLNIENFGHFPFRYKIILPNKISNSPSVPDETRNKKDQATKSVKAEKSIIRKGTGSGSKADGKSPRSEKIASGSSRTGPFVLSKTEGEIEGENMETIEIECRPETAGSMDEEIRILVANTKSKNEPDGEPVKLSVTGCIPTIDFSDLEAIFKESVIVYSIADFKCPRELGPHSVYARQEQILYFRRVILSSVYSSRFRLRNPGFVFADVMVTFKEKNCPFIVEPCKSRIAPMSTEIFTISFEPEVLGSYEAVLDINLELPVPLKSSRLSVKIHGEVVVPEISLIEPSTPSANGQFLVNFGRSLSGEISYQALSLKNVGFVEARIILELNSDTSDAFAFEDENRGKMLQPRNKCAAEQKRRIVCRLMPEEIYRLNIKFAPNDIGKYEGRVCVFTVNNPYEEIVLLILGESYDEFLVLEGLELAEDISATSLIGKRSSRSRKNSSRKSQQKLPFEFIAPIATYNLNFGGCFFNENKRKCFKIVNKSAGHLFRFEWSSHPNVELSPSIGYLDECASKDIVATFLASEPIVLTETQLDCTINEITWLSEEGEQIFWDDRQSDVRWSVDEAGDSSEEKIFKKIVESAPEPAERFYVVPGSTKIIRLMLTAISAYSRYDCDIKEINIEDTLAFQTRRYSFTLTNPGIVDTLYKWDFSTETQHLALRGSSVSREAYELCRSSGSRAAARTSGGMLFPKDYEDPAKTFLAASCAVGTHARPRSSESCRNSDTENFIEPNYVPFKITPDSGILLPGESVLCSIFFSPLDVFDYKAHFSCRIKNLDPELPPLNITVTARSLLSYCHFHLPPEPDHSDKDKSNVRVIEFQVVGIGETHVKKIRMTNPTREDYHYSWRECNADAIKSGDEISYFDCSLAEGISERGKQTEFTFTFLAKEFGVFQSLWIFSIDLFNLETTFLIRAKVAEPSVYLLPGHLKIRPTITGAKERATVTIFNRENIPLSFRVKSDSLYSEGRVQRLTVNPMSGTLQPTGEQRLEIQFRASSAGESEFSVRCWVEKLKNPLAVFVSTTTYDIEPSVVYEIGDSKRGEIYPEKYNDIDCGNMQVGKPFTLNIQITNVGRSMFYYSWDFNDSDETNGPTMFAVNAPETRGNVAERSRVVCPLTIITHRTAAVLNRRITLKIDRGPEFGIILKGFLSRSSYFLNFNTYDFGPSYIRSDKNSHYSTKIHFTNNEETPCTLECKYNNVPHVRVFDEYLPGFLPGFSSVSIPVKFIPLDRIRYREQIRLLINSTVKEDIAILGEGIEYKLRLVDRRQKFVDLGHLALGKTVTRRIPLINEGRAPLILKIDLASEIPSKEEEKKTMTRLQTPLLKNSLTIEPSESVTLDPNKKLDVVVTYSPIRRAKTFEEKVVCQINEDISLPLFIIKATCLGAEFFLEKSSLSFGTVVEGCSQNSKVTLTNTGDIGSRFIWDVSSLTPHFDLVPRTGYCSPGMNMSFNVIFTPKCRSNSIKGEAIINIENYRTMRLEVSGACQSFPEPSETVNLVTRVRQSTSADIILPNISEQNSTLKPIVSGCYFTVPSILKVSSLESNFCTVTYKPLTMTSDDDSHLHRGTLFLKLPEGKGISYALVGSSLPPDPVAKIHREFPAKTKYTESLSVSNWLNEPQKFSCIIELLNNVKMNSVYSFVGNKTIDVTPEVERDYRAIFYSYEEGDFHFRVTFKNDEGEYQYYELYYKVTESGIIDTINMTASVRTIARHPLKLENPLRDRPLTYTIRCTHPCIEISEVSKLVQPGSTEIVEIEFKPYTLPFESITKLDATCPDLGTFSYALSLKATSPPPEKLIHVSAELGNSTVVPITIKNYSKQAANFTITINDPSFLITRNVFPIQGLAEDNIEIMYEPCELRIVSATVTATSETAGEYIFPITGTPLQPKPRGPFLVASGQSASIPFKNIFEGTRTFLLRVNPPEEFCLVRSTETIQSKKTVAIAVGLGPRKGVEKEPGIDAPTTGKLVVSCTDATLSHIKWTFYLRADV